MSIIIGNNPVICHCNRHENTIILMLEQNGCTRNFHAHSSGENDDNG